MADTDYTSSASGPGNAGRWLVSHDLGGRLRRLLGSLPGATYAEDQLQQAEDVVLRELKARLDRVSRKSQRSDVAEGGSHPAAPGDAENPGDTMTRLLAESVAQTKEQAENSVYVRLLGELLPDEARIVAALSDGEPHALVHVGHGPPVGSLTQQVAPNLSALGRAAQVRALDHVPHYIDHLRALGLVRIGPGLRELALKYQIIENDKPVRELVQDLNQTSGKHVRFSRHSLRITALGEGLWNACQGDLSAGTLGWGDA